jgi:hypothetical protein
MFSLWNAYYVFLFKKKLIQKLFSKGEGFVLLTIDLYGCKNSRILCSFQI